MITARATLKTHSSFPKAWNVVRPTPKATGWVEDLALSLIGVAKRHAEHQAEPYISKKLDHGRALQGREKKSNAATELPASDDVQ